MTNVDRERIAALFYILMRDHEWTATDLEDAIRSHALKVQGQAVFTDPDLAVDARRMARLMEAKA